MPKSISLRMKVYGLLGLILVLGTGGYFLNRYLKRDVSTAQAESNSPESKKPDVKEATPVELATATKDKISSYLSSTANLRALREVEIASQTDGIVQRILVEEGDFVEQGRLLCQLDDTQLRIRLLLAQERLAQAKLQLEKARIRQEKAAVQIENTKIELARLQQAFDEKLISERELAQAKYRLDELLHDLRVSTSETREFTHRTEELEAEIKQSNLEISRTQIKAPFSGHITQRVVDIGRAARNLEPLFRLGTFSPLYADVHLSERDARQVHSRQIAIIRLGVEESIQSRGSVARISPVVDQATGTVKVTVELNPGQSGFKPGAFVRVEIQTDTRTDAVLIPKRAVLEEDNEKFVFVADGEKAIRTKVTVGYENASHVEVRTGVSTGQKVVIAGQGGLKDGAKIKVIQS